MSKSNKGKDKSALEIIESTARDAIEQGEKVWLAGLGVLARAQDEGRDLVDADKVKLYEDLVKTGRKFADQAKDKGQSQLDDARKAIRDAFDKARDDVKTTYDRAIDQTESGVDKIAESLGIEHIFDRRVGKVLDRLGYPTKKQFDALNRKVNALSKTAATPKASTPKAATPKAAKSKIATPKAKAAAAPKKTA